ncbi:MAG: MFS transporter [Pseudomonadota bacterium]
MTETRKYGYVVLVAASLMSAVLGSVHAFSVFLGPLEAQFGASRSAVSFTYSAALVCLTAAVLLGHRFYGRVSAAAFMIISAAMAASGAALAGIAPSLMIVWLGYSVLFGVANGLGYGFGLQIAAQANPGREGVAMGVVTAAYALGAVLSPALFALLLKNGFGAAMIGLSCVLLAAGLCSALAMRSVKARFSMMEASQHQTGAPTKSIAVLWLAYFGGVMAGLMVIGHAAGILAEISTPGGVWLAPAIVAICNLLGSLLGGRLSDRFLPTQLLTCLPALTALSLLGLMAGSEWFLVILCLGFAGFAYGGTIAAYPAYIAKRFGIDQSAQVYGKVFTAWGTAGLAGPWFAGLLYDWNGSYHFALVIAAAFAVVSVLSVPRAFRVL